MILKKGMYIETSIILNKRLTDFIESNSLLNFNQAGFRKKHSTTDNVFILHILSEYYKVKKTKLYCTFIDFKKAFDSVRRAWAMVKNH